MSISHWADAQAAAAYRAAYVRAAERCPKRPTPAVGAPA